MLTTLYFDGGHFADIFRDSRSRRTEVALPTQSNSLLYGRRRYSDSVPLKDEGGKPVMTFGELRELLSSGRVKRVVRSREALFQGRIVSSRGVVVGYVGFRGEKAYFAIPRKNLLRIQEIDPERRDGQAYLMVDGKMTHASKLVDMLQEQVVFETLNELKRKMGRELEI